MRPLRFASILAVAWATLALAGCATMRVGSFVERGTNFTVYRTYAWASDAQLSTGDPRLDNNEFFQRAYGPPSRKDSVHGGSRRRSPARLTSCCITTRA